MVGLRWWNYIDEDGKSHWVFEARKVSISVRIYFLSCLPSYLSSTLISYLTVFTLFLIWCCEKLKIEICGCKSHCSEFIYCLRCLKIFIFTVEDILYPYQSLAVSAALYFYS